MVTRTSGTGSLTYAATYEAFGTRTQEAGTNPDRQRANTKEEDPTGLLNEGFRYRDLETGMFISRDPAGFVNGPNVYTYVRQNPWSAFDPHGLWWKAVLSQALDMVPVVGTIKATVECVTGRDIVSGDPVDRVERGLTAASSIVPGGSALAKGVKVASSAYDTYQTASGAVEMAETIVEGGTPNPMDVAGMVADVVGGKRNSGGGGHGGGRGTDRGGTDSPDGSSPRDTRDQNEEGNGLDSNSIGNHREAAIENTSVDTTDRPVMPGDEGTYGELKERKRLHGEVEPLDMDHQPSFAAQVAARESVLGRKLDDRERAALKENTPAVASPRAIHQQTSPTFGGRNSPARITEDAKDLEGARKRDRAVFEKAMEERT